MTGTSPRTPATVASAAPEPGPNWVSLCERFGADQLSGMLNLLRFLGPITTVSQGNSLGFMRVV